MNTLILVEAFEN